MKRWLKRIFLIAAAGSVLAVIVMSMVPDPIEVDVAAVEQGRFRVTVDVEGRTRVKDRYVVSTPLAGRLQRIDLHPGDPVEAGAVVARLGPLEAPLLDARTREQAQLRVLAAEAAVRQADALVDRARVARQQAELDQARLARLVDRGAASTEMLEQARTALRTHAREVESSEFGARIARHEVDIARANLRRASGGAPAGEMIEVRSPIAGHVLRVREQSEGAVAAGQALVEIGDLAGLEIVADVLTAEVVAVRPGAAVEIAHWGGDGSLMGRVRRVEPSAFTKVSALGVEEQRVNVLIDFDEPRERWAALGDGFRVEVKITTWEGASELSIPSSALFRDGPAWAVFRWHEGHAARTRVEVPRRSGVRVMVSAGLSVSDRVIIHPGDGVREGVAVAVRGE
jgi:HlyD family secretion protein